MILKIFNNIYKKWSYLKTNRLEESLYNYTFYMIHRKGLNIIDIYDEENGEHYIGSTRNFKNRYR
jgi:hypothetical protein